MFQAKLSEGILLKKLIESIKDLVTDINLDITSTGISLQAMDSSHVALVTLNLSSDGFEEYRCDKQMTLGVSVANLAAIFYQLGVFQYSQLMGNSGLVHIEFLSYFGYIFFFLS